MLTEDLTSFISNTFPHILDDEINEKSRLFDDGIVDSFGILEILSFIEQKYNIKVGDDEVIEENFATIENIVDYLEQKKQFSA